jgi:HK97 family phage portal protein
MGRIAEFFEKRSVGFSLADLDRSMDEAVYGQPTMTGVKVSEQNALKYSPYFAGVRLISETIGQIPLDYFIRVQRLSGRRGKEKAVDDNLYWLLHSEPNPEMDAVSFKSALAGQAATWGNAYAEIEWDMESGEVKALWPLDVSKMQQIYRDPETQELKYAYRTPDGITRVLPAWRIWHLAGFGYNGITGYNNIDLNRESLGLGKALEENAARFFGNGSRPGGVLTHPGKLSPESKKANIKHWQEEYGGLSNIARIAILDEGITYKEIGIPPATAQQLESRTFQVQEVSRMLNVAPHKLMELSHATFSNIEHQDMEFMKYTMGIWFRRWEQVCNRKLILPDQRRKYFFEFNEDALLKADSASRAAFYKELSYLGVLSPNDIREKENMNPIEDESGDWYSMQRNMIPMHMIEDVIKSETRQKLQGNERRNSSFDDTIRKIADRERERILRAIDREGENFGEWLEDYYRDFHEWVERQVEPDMGDESKTWASLYITRSQADINAIPADMLKNSLSHWVEDRVAMFANKE